MLFSVSNNFSLKINIEWPVWFTCEFSTTDRLCISISAMWNDDAIRAQYSIVQMILLWAYKLHRLTAFSMHILRTLKYIHYYVKYRLFVFASMMMIPVCVMCMCANSVSHQLNQIGTHWASQATDSDINVEIDKWQNAIISDDATRVQNTSNCSQNV